MGLVIGTNFIHMSSEGNNRKNVRELIENV